MLFGTYTGVLIGLNKSCGGILGEFFLGFYGLFKIG
jgi:hypothetical protein